MPDTNIIYIGQKQPAIYVHSVIVQSNKNENGTVIIKARGKNISKAVDVALISIDQHIKTWKILASEIFTELNVQEENDQRVSAIQITLQKSDA